MSQFSNVELANDFGPEADWHDWSYISTAGVMPYAHGIRYLNPFASLAELDSVARAEGTAIQISDDSFTLTNGKGLQVGCVRLPEDGSPYGRPLRFEAPELRPGEQGQSSITSLYPRVEFPRQGNHLFALNVIYGPELFGRANETYEIVVTEGATADSLVLDPRIPDIGREMIAHSLFAYGGGYHPAGKFKVEMDVTRVLAACIRFDGGMPLRVQLLRPGSIHEMQAEAQFEEAQLSNFQLPRLNKNPLGPDVNNAKYTEVGALIAPMPYMYPSLFSHQVIQDGGGIEEEPLIFPPTDGPRVAGNPNAGMVEVHLAEMVVMNELSLNFSEDEAPALPPIISKRTADLQLNPSKIDWGRHLQIFRFCLTST